MSWRLDIIIRAWKIFGAKVEKKTPAPFDFGKMISDFKLDFCTIEPEKRQCPNIAFSIWKRNKILCAPFKYIISKKGIDKNNLCRLINLSINPKDCNQCTGLSLLSFLVLLRLSCSKYIVYLSAWVYKVHELSCCLSLIAP